MIDGRSCQGHFPLPSISFPFPLQIHSQFVPTIYSQFHRVSSISPFLFHSHLIWLRNNSLFLNHKLNEIILIALLMSFGFQALFMLLRYNFLFFFSSKIIKFIAPPHCWTSQHPNENSFIYKIIAQFKNKFKKHFPSSRFIIKSFFLKIKILFKKKKKKSE